MCSSWFCFGFAGSDLPIASWKSALTFCFFFGPFHHEENLPELACWRDVRYIWSREPSHPSWGHPRSASWQSTWQLIVDAWVNLAKIIQGWSRVAELPSGTRGWWKITNGCCFMPLSFGVACCIAITNWFSCTLPFPPAPFLPPYYNQLCNLPFI